MHSLLHQKQLASRLNFGRNNEILKLWAIDFLSLVTITMSIALRTVATLSIMLAVSSEGRAAPVFGTLEIDFRLEWDGSSFGADGTLYSPHLEYWDRANDSTMDIPIEHIVGQLPSFSSPYQNTYTTVNFPRPDANDMPYGGFLAYYRNADSTEGMIVGLAPAYTPVNDFDTLFNPPDFIVGVSETEALNALKNPVPGTPQTPGSVFSIMVIVNPEIMPRWQYNAINDTYSLSMNLYAFSEPQRVGSSESGATFSVSNTVPEPTSLVLAGQGVLALAALGLRFATNRAARRP